MSASPQRRLRRLLESRGYTLTETNEFGTDIWTADGIEPFQWFANLGGRQLEAALRNVERATRNRKSPEQREFDELERVRREHAVAERAKTTRAQINAWNGLPFTQINAIAARVEAEETKHRQTALLMRHYPSNDIR